MATYDELRADYKPRVIRYLLIAESPPPAAHIQSSRHFYRSEMIRKDDRLFVNTIKALYPQTESMSEEALEKEKETWLRAFQSDGYFMIEALPTSQPHHVTKKERQVLIAKYLPQLIAKVTSLADSNTKLILIKSNVYEVAAKALQDAGFTVLNTRIVDYPGRYNQTAYRDKLRALTR